MKLSQSNTSFFNSVIRRSTICPVNFDDFARIHKKLEPSMPGLKPISHNHNMIRRRTICRVKCDDFAQILDKSGNCLLKTKLDYDFLEPSMLGIEPEPPKWPERDELIKAGIQRRANSVDLPLSLRMIKKKQRLNVACRDSDDSIRRVHSSMVFIILVLQIYALKMRGSDLEDNEAVIAHIHGETNDYFAWLFKQIFPQSPNMMICLMTLLADFFDYSLPMENSGFDSLTGESISCKFVEPNLVRKEDYNSGEEGAVDVTVRTVGNLNRMIGEQDLVMPLEIKQDGYVDYQRTELQYQMNLSRDPNNSLLWCNYASFLQVILHDYDRAEDCFKRATQVTPPDAEALNRYANFLWVVRNDLAGAEQKYINAIEVEPTNTYYASSYADFLWSSGGDGTCLLL